MYTYLFYDLCAVLTLATLILALIIRKLVNGRSNNLFLATTVSAFASGILDIVTVYLDNMPNLSEYYTMVRMVLNTLFFLVHNIGTPLYIVYICSIVGLWHELSRKKMLFHLLGLPYLTEVILIIANLFNHKIFYIDDDLTYMHGSWILGLYCIGLAYMIVGIAILAIYRKRVSGPRFLTLLIFMPVTVLAILLQAYATEFRIEIFIEALLLVITAETFHRPEEKVDNLTGIQSHNAFIDEVRTNFLSKSHVNYLFMKVCSYDSQKKILGFDDYVKMLRKVADKTEKLCDVMVGGHEFFYLDQGVFAVETPGDKYEGLLDTGRTMMAYLQEPMLVSGTEILVAPHICIARCPDDIKDETALLDFAATFQNKLAEEKGVIELKKIAGSKEFAIRNNIDAIIKSGIENHNFRMFYQPIYSIKEKKFTSAEALIRLIDPQYGFVSPGIFIPAAEESGAIHNIGDFVIEDVCRFVGSIEFEKLGLEYIELNLSVAQLIENNISDKIIATMKKYGVRPEQLNLEITETAADYDPKTTDMNLQKLHEAGLNFSLDDYGTGYSNITRVTKLPVNIVKLDKSLVDDMDTPLMWVVIKNTVDMLKGMKKKILVEGVEDARALNRFAEIGCDHIQGYYFSKPLPEVDYLEFIRKNNICGDLT